MKNTFKTAEFWTTLIGATISIIVLTGKLTPEQGTEVANTVTSVVESIITLLATLGFTKNRANVKMQVFHAKCEMLHARINAPKDPLLKMSAAASTSAIDEAAKDL